MVRLVSASTAIKYAKHLTGRLAFRLEEHFTDPNALLSEQVRQSLPFWLSYILAREASHTNTPQSQWSTLFFYVPHI